MITKEDYKGLTELSEKRYSKYYDWIRHLIIMATWLIGILISLKTKNVESGFRNLMYLITICGLGIGILSGSVCLYSEIHTLDKFRKLYAERLIKISKGATYTHPFESVSKNWIFIFLEVICFSSLFISIISLIAYGIIRG